MPSLTSSSAKPASSAGTHDQADAQSERAAACARDQDAGKLRDGPVQRTDVAERIERRSAFRFLAVTPDREIGARAGQRHDVGLLRRLAHDRAELTDHICGKSITRRCTLDHDRTDTILDFELEHAFGFVP